MSDEYDRRLDDYERLVATQPGVNRKGATSRA
jgi:hypothetical protein